MPQIVFNMSMQRKVCDIFQGKYFCVLYSSISLYIGPVANWKYSDAKDLNVPASCEHLCRTHITILWSLGESVYL